MFNIKSLILLLATVALLQSCRTTEANYREAYQAAVAGREDTSGIDKTVYDKIRREAQTVTVISLDGDSIPSRREHVKLTETPNGALQPAYVVVAQFKQRFNARSLRDRLAGEGYPDALLLETREPLYYVTIGGGTVHEASQLYKQYLASPILPVKAPYPLILQPAR